MLRLLLLPALLCLAMGCTTPSDSTALADPADPAPIPETDLPLEQIQLPEGFTIEVYADGMDEARSLELTDAGTLFIGTRRTGAVYAVRDEDGNGHGETVYTIDEGLAMPNGVVFHDGDLYVAEVSRILRYDDIESRLDNPPEPVVVRDDLPTETHHGWKFIDIGPDGKLYVPVGAPCNICDEPDPFATILRMDVDGSNQEVFARGVRNTVGFAWHPVTDELYFTDNGRDMMGDDVPPCELNYAPRQGMHFGYPYIHGASVEDPEFGEGHTPGEYVAPVILFQAHTAPLGIEFYTGDQFPSEYQGEAYVAQHGSWNRSSKVGYRVMRVRFDETNRAVSAEPFAEGWLQGEENWGRPVDLEQMPDGSLLLSDDQTGVVYRIRYTG